MSSYKVIARKCRPQLFENVVGQQHVTRTLKNAIRDKRIAHAFLFTGERGVGKTSIARILAKALNCHTGPTESPCGECVSCREITAGNSLDVHEIDGASNTGVDDIRTLRENIKYLPSRDRYKIYIIDEVHMLSTSAFNALLKTLEEPPEHVIFMFATTEPHKIPDTIISRCLRFDFKRIPIKEIAAHLTEIARNEEVTISQRGLFLIARESDGSMRDAQTLLERAIAYCGGTVKDEDLEELLGHIDRRFLYRVLEAVLEENAQEVIEGLSEVYEYGVDLKQFYFSFLELLRDLLVIKSAGSSARLVDLADEDLKQLEGFAGRVSLEELLRCFRLCFASEPEMVRSRFPRIALELCLLEMVHCKQAMLLDEAIDKIESLASGGGVSPAAASVAPPQPSAPPRKRPQPAEQGGAAVEAAPAGAPSDSDGEALLSFIAKKHPPTASKLAHGSVALTGDQTVTISLPAGSFFLDQMKEPENEKRLVAWCTEFFGRQMQVAITASRDQKKKQQVIDDREELKKKRQTQAMHNPVIQKVMETFNGKIVDIRTDDA